jgi:uncharacterized repeat protein (TIGR03806 family)
LSASNDAFGSFAYLRIVRSRSAAPDNPGSVISGSDMQCGRYVKETGRRVGFTWAGVAAGWLLALAGCGGSGGSSAEFELSTPAPAVTVPGTPTATTLAVFTAADAPAKLSAWNVLHSDGQTLALRPGVVPYSLNTPLFSDYSHKLRTLSIPAGTRIDYVSQGPLQFPVGAVVTKTFFYPRAEASASGLVGAVQGAQVDGGETVDLAQHRLIETRLMVREPSGQWGAVTYVWDADHKDATLLRTGQAIDIELVSAQGGRSPFTYAVPTDGQCVTCHATNASTGAFEAIGPQASNLNRDYAYANGSQNQLDHLAALQMLSGYASPAPRMVVWNDAQAASVEARARAYLDVNCASCHNPVGRSRNTGLWLGVQETSATRLGVCKQPMGGQQNGRFSYDIQPGNADQSFLYFRIGNYRLNADPPSVAMPELGRHVFHTEGNALVREWINGMSPSCGS